MNRKFVRLRGILFLVLFVFGVFNLFVSLETRAASGDEESQDPRVARSCDPAIALSTSERRDLLTKLRISMAGRQILADFIRQYHSLSNLVIQWDSVSYSQVAPLTAESSRRAPASDATARESSGLGEAICVHLARRLPELEHVADLAHELTHATRLEMKVLKGEVENVEEFVELRLRAKGGEADAFSVECQVKRELLGYWDSFCAPYADSDSVDADRVIKDFYSGRLSASLTGEPYPVMLGRQYRAMLAKKADVAKSQARKPIRYSGLENKETIQ